MIIKDLINEGFCFAILQSWSYLTREKIYSNKDWEIIALKSDYKDLRKLGFDSQDYPGLLERHRNPKGIISRELTTEELREFKALKEDYFTQVVDEKDGAIWELKKMPFRKYFNQQNNGYAAQTEFFTQ
ncbi:hypothetical protein LEQ03_02670 [Riemerella anatipestifer]|uniref:hypothetical protein n=1 Tax=Riemerella anatipestifer TaxID=34085 RepID=UPI00129E0FE0|nr:hypothetical protein [Riemerella anatipestifer]MRM84537.1 hypothetical protein [Riemerella anatipestifer]WPC10766.1 hypothetical protein LEQ05_13000 [Riemerella anatipestifer]WPC13585.1 hypothetical protein LEQ03_02670 [Riemerella anatipestifer]